MQHEILVPDWAKGDPRRLLSFLSHYAGLQYGPGGGIVHWAEAAGLSRKTVYNAMARGSYTPKAARALVSVLPDGVMPAYWLIDPQSIRVTEQGTIVYGN